MAKVTQPDLHRAGPGNHASDSQHALPLGAVGLRGWTAAALGRMQGIAILASKPKCTGPGKPLEATSHCHQWATRPLSKVRPLGVGHLRLHRSVTVLHILSLGFKFAA